MGRGDLPGGTVVKNPPSNTKGMGVIPGWGTKIPHAMEQLNLYAATTESVSKTLRAPIKTQHSQVIK